MSIRMRLVTGEHDGHKEQHEAYQRGYAAALYDARDSHPDQEMRRRSRMSEYDDYDDTEMRRRRSRMHAPEYDDYDDTEMRRRSRMHMPEHEDTEMRRRRSRMSEYDEHEEAEMRRRLRAAMEYFPWDAEPRQIGFGNPTAHHGKASEGHGAMEHRFAHLKKLIPNLDDVLKDASQVIQNPPSTWGAYLKSHDLHGIAKMEGKELMSAIEQKKPAKDIHKELVHTIAALVMLAGE